MGIWEGIGHALERLIGLAFIKWLTRLILTIQGHRQQKRYMRLSLAMNILRFATQDSVKDRLIAYRASKSKANWRRVMVRANDNSTKLMELRKAVDALRRDASLGRDPAVASLLDELVRDKKDELYARLSELREHPPRADAAIDDLIRRATELDARRGEVDQAQKAVVKRIEEARKNAAKDEEGLVH